jgi:hypothetical protein
VISFKIVLFQSHCWQFYWHEGMFEIQTCWVYVDFKRNAGIQVSVAMSFLLARYFFWNLACYSCLTLRKGQKIPVYRKVDIKLHVWILLDYTNTEELKGMALHLPISPERDVLRERVRIIYIYICRRFTACKRTFGHEEEPVVSVS